MRRFEILSLILIILISACNKEDSGIITKNSGLLYQVKFGSELYAEYTYNDQSQVVEEKSRMFYTKHNYKDGKLISSEHYYDPGMYSSTGVIAQAAMNRKEWVNPLNTEKSSTKNYFYDSDGKLTRTLNELNNCEYTYDDLNRIDRQIFYNENKVSGYIEFYYDDRDNMVKRLHYWILTNGEPELQTTTEYEFDNNPNPYQSLQSLMLPGKYSNTNNIVKETYTIHGEVDSWIKKVTVTENKYTYNSQGFPISKDGMESYIYY